MSPFDQEQMRRALHLAARGQGHVEPNPMVGCVLCRDAVRVGEGYHGRYGQAHAEAFALAAAGDRAAGATMYVTLEPCCHQGKTPPCTEAIIRAGVRRVVVAAGDPFPRVDGGGIEALERAGIEVETGVLESEARDLNAPYIKLTEQGRPWVIAKWAMTLDGKIATGGGESRWISGEASRKIVHELRGRVDAILVGSGTARTDDPRLTARPPGARVATRVVVDSRAALSTRSQLVTTAGEVPVLIAAGREACAENVAGLTGAGCEVFFCEGDSHPHRVESLLDELGRRRMTHVLVEGGGRLLGTLFDARQIDEIHVFIAPKLVGGATATSPIAGRGIDLMARAIALSGTSIQTIGEDLYVSGRTVPATDG